MSDTCKSKRSRKNRGNRRKHNNKNKTNQIDRKPNEEEEEDDGDDDTTKNIEAIAAQLNIPSYETISEINIKCAETYTVESPQQTLKQKEKKKIQNAPKSKSLDNEDDAVLNIVELEAKSSDDDKSFIENSAVITEAESDVEWEVADTIKHEDSDDASQKETDLRLFLKTLNLVDSPAEPIIPPTPPPIPELKIDDKELPPVPVNDSKLKKAQKKAALEEHCIAQYLRPRFLDIIDEEGSNESSDATRRESMLSDRSSKYADDADDDVFVVEKKVKEPLEYFPKHKDYQTCKKDLRRQQECKLVGAKIIESEFEEGCGSWTIESTEKQRGAEIVYLDDSSSSTSENAEDVNESELIDVEERVNIKTPVIELNSQYGVAADSIPGVSSVDFNYSNAIGDGGEVEDSEGVKSVNLQSVPGNNFAANEELIESLENLLVSAPTPVACNEVIMLANEFVDELPIVTEVLKEAKSPPNRTILHVDEINLDSLSSCPSGEESSSKDSNSYTRQDSSSSVCSSSHSTSHSTAKYNPLSSSLTDIDALVHDDLTSAFSNANSPTGAAEKTNLCENVTGDGEKSEGSGAKAPSPLKELCVGKVASLPYGNEILKELAFVSQSLSNFASEALSREMPDVMQMKPEVPPRSPQNCAMKVPQKPKLPPVLNREKIPPPVAPRQSSFKVLHEEPSSWVGLQSQKDPSLVAYLSPLQKKQIETAKNYSSDEAGELIDMHRKYTERRGYDEMLANSEKEPSASNNNDDKIAVQVERPAPDTGNRLLAIIRDPLVNPNVHQADVEPMQNSIESSFDFIETLRTFEDMNKDLANDQRFRSWSKKDGNVKETLEIAEHTTSNKTFKAIAKPGNFDATDFTLKPIKENVVETDHSEIVTNGTAAQKSHEKIVKITMEDVAKNAPDNRDPKTRMQSLLNKREFLLDDPVFKSDLFKNFSAFNKETSPKRRGSLPKEIHDRQIEYILQKEKEIQEQIKQLEEEKRLAHFESKVVTESSSFDNYNNTVKESEQSVTVNGKQIHFESSKESQNLKAGKVVNLISAPSEGEKFREQMYSEYMDKVAEREERKQNRVIKISNAAETVIPIVHEKSVQSSETMKRKCSEIEEEFIIKAKERWDKLGFKDPESRDSPVVIEHKVKVLDGEGEKDLKKLPTHLQEFVEFTSNGDQSEPVMFAPTFKAKAPASGVWTPGAATSPGVSSSGKSNRPAVNGEVSSPPQAASAAPPPPPPPPPPIWSPTAKKASPILEKKEYRPVASPKAARKQINQQNPEKKTPPPWEVRLAGSQSAPDAGALNGLVAPKLPPQPALPRAQNPTITLLQKAREGQLPRGASYLEQDRDLPNDRRLSPPRVNPGEAVYSLRRGYMSEPESGSDRTRKMADIRPKQYEGIGPTTKDGMPIVLRSEVKEVNQSKWYKKMYDTIHKNKFDDDYITVRYKSRRAHPSTIHSAPRNPQYAYFNPKSGYLSEPEGGGGGNAGWSSDAYDSDAPTRRHSALDRRRASDKENVVNSQYLPSNKYSTLASAKASQEVYKNQPGRIEDYVPGRSSVVDKEAKQWWDEVMDIFDGWLDENSPLPPYSTLLARAIERSQLSNPPNHQPQLNSKHNISSSILSKSYMARALKESGYESDSTLVLRRREGGPLEAPLSPQEQKLAYRSLQAGGEPPLHGFRKPAPDKPKDDTEIEYFPLSPTLTRIRVHKNAAHDILCYPITSTITDVELFSKYQQAPLPSFITLDYPKANKYDPPAPPRRLSSKANSTLKLVSSIPTSTNTLQTNVKYIQNKLSNKSSNPPQKENRKKELRETKMKSADGKRIKTTRATVPVPTSSSKVKTGTKSSSTKRIVNENVKCTSSFSSPRRTMSPVEYASANLNKLYSENLMYNREVIEGGAGRRTPISGILDRGVSLDRTFASEKKNLPLKSIQEYPNKALSRSTETLILSDNGKTKDKRTNSAAIKKSLISYSSMKNGGRLSDDKRSKISMSISARGRELIRTSDKFNIDKQSNTIPIPKKTTQSYSTSLPLKKSSSLTRQRKSLEDITSKVKSSNSSLNSIKSTKSVTKPSKCHEACKTGTKLKDNQFGDFKPDKSNASKSSKRTSKENDRKQSAIKSKSHSGVKSPKSLDKATLQYIKSVNREIDSYVSQYENNPIVNYNEIMDQRDAVMSDSFFQHLLLRGVPPQTSVEPDDSYYSTSVLEKAKLFQSGNEPWPVTNRPVNSYLSHKKPVTDSKFRTWDRYERSRPRSPRAVSWPGRMSQSCIKKFDSLSNRSINHIGTSLIFPQVDNRSRSEPPLNKIVFSQTTRPRSPVVTRHIKRSDSPKKIVYQRTQSPPAKMIFSQTSRPLSPVVVHTKKRKIPEPVLRLPSPSKIVLTETSRPVTPTLNRRRLKDPEEIQCIRSRSESPVLPYKSDFAYYSDSEPLRKRASPSKHTGSRKIREESPSPSPMRSPSCRRIHSARISQCKAEDCISSLKKKIIRTHSAGDAEAKEKSDSSFVRSSSLNLEHIKNHLDYQEYITEMKHRKGKSDRFKELNKFYAYLERIGELERTTSSNDLRPRGRYEEIIDFDRWKRVRAMERAEEELDRLYKKMKVEQQEKDLLFLPHDAESFRWSQYKDWNLRIKEKSVEDLRDHFTKLADNESDRHDYYKRESDCQRDTYKPLWRGNSVVNLASSITKRHPIKVADNIGRTVTKPRIDPNLGNIRERLGIGSRLWSSLSMEQVSALKNQLNSIYSKDLDSKSKEIVDVNEDYIITVPDVTKEKPKNGLQVRCNSFTVGDVVNSLEPNKNIKADSISSIQNFPLDKDMKNSLNTYQNLSEREKKRISMTLSQEILERVKQGRENYSPVILAKETRGATATSRIRGIAKNQSDSPRVCYSDDISEDEKPRNDFTLVLSPNNHCAEEIKRTINEWSEGRSKEDKKNDDSPSPLHPSSASETETGSSDASNRTVIFRGNKEEVQKKVEFFERSKDEDASGTIIYHARDDSFEDNKHDSLQSTDEIQNIMSSPSSSTREETKPNKLSHSQSYSSLKELFGETQMNNYASLSPVVQKKPSKVTPKPEPTNTALSSVVSSMDNICRSRSLSPDPERYWRAYLSLVKAGEVQKLKKKFEFNDDYMYDFEESLPKLRRHQSDPEIIRTILQHNWNKKNPVNVKRHERGDVDRLTHKYETSSRGRSRYRKHGLTSPISKNPLRLEDRDMPHIDVISKIASLKPDTSTQPITGEYPIECPIGEVHKIRKRFESTSLLGKMFTSTPDIHELRDIAPYLSGPWVAHKYPKRQDNNRSLSTSDYITEDKYAPVRKDRPRPKSTSPIRPQKPSSILKQGNNSKAVDFFADQEFDPVKHRPRYRYLPPRDEPPARPAYPHQLQQHTATTRPTVTFKDPELAPIPPPKGVPISRDYSPESPRRYVESDVTIHYRVPVRQEPRPLVPEDELARRQADHMRRVYQEERRRKYLQELQDMNSRRHTDNFTPSQKSPISLNRYDSFGTRQVARALYNFVGQGARELSFRKGDLILVRRQIDNNWYEGEHNNTIGLFPYNYVEMIQYDSTTTPSQRRPTEGRARAKFNFVAQTHLELGLRKGELVTLIRRVDDNWYEGRLGDRKGIFPVSYVEVLAEPTMNRSELPSSIGSGKPVASPAAHSMVGAAGAASLGPHRYTPQLNSPALSNSPSSTAPLALPNHGITSHHARPASATLPRATDHTPINLNNHEPLFVDTNAEAVPYRAMYKYRPQNPDELELQEGDTVYVLEKCDDGWYVGSSQRSGRFGTFPGNYVEKI